MLVAAAALSLAFAAGPPAAPVRDCHDRITGASVTVNGRTTPYRFEVRPERDRVIGPVAFVALPDYEGAWDEMVRRDQWLKSIALVRPGARVTLVVPAAQRAWMRLAYGGARAVTLQGCRRPATREECGPGPDDTCRSGPTPFGGGFEIDYARAPRQGRCAELTVWFRGHAQRRRLFPGACA